VKVRNGIARSPVAATARGVTILAVSVALVLGGAVAAPSGALAASTVRVDARIARYTARFAPKPKAPAAPVVGGWYRAKVSWYGPGLYGHGMAGGGTLRPDSMVVAHRTLPFGTRVEFAYGGKRVIAVVKDRGPFIAGRMFDLGPGTAKAIGFDRVGVGVVQYRILR
jgi:hypothetical protein